MDVCPLNNAPPDPKTTPPPPPTELTLRQAQDDTRGSRCKIKKSVGCHGEQGRTMVRKGPTRVALRRAQDDTHLRHDFGILGMDKTPA